MRGSDESTGALFSYVDLEARVAAVHPLQAIRLLVNKALSAMGSDLSALYWGLGRPSHREPLRVCRRPFRLRHAAMSGSSSIA